MPKPLYVAYGFKELHGFFHAVGFGILFYGEVVFGKGCYEKYCVDGFEAM